jgi:hypothetical protein
MLLALLPPSSTGFATQSLHDFELQMNSRFLILSRLLKLPSIATRA